MDIPDEKINLILTARKSLLTLNDSTWTKCQNDNFDVPMGAYDSAQVADLVCIYILDTLSRIVNPKQIGLYRDDGLLFISNSNGPLTSKIQMKIIRAFKLLGFRIEISTSLKIVDLGITLTLNNKTFKSYHKDNENLSYN